MLGIPEAADALSVSLRKKTVEKNVQDAFDNLTSCLVLLRCSSPSVQTIRKLCVMLRQPLIPLYNTCFQPALQLSSSVLSSLLGKSCDAHSVGDESLRAAWDATSEVILSGILDFLDQKDSANFDSDPTVWEVLYRLICEFFFPDCGRGWPTFSVPLRLSAYNTLTEIAARQTTARNALRQRAILGGERLGAVISRTREYLLLEALLMLFARLLPPTHATSQGKLRRVKFVKEVLGSPKLFKCSAELLDIMYKTSDTHWDDVAAQIIDALARIDITYPQPFSIDEIDVCGRIFPQPLATDRLIVDKQAFLANIIAENDDICESLQVPYSHIRTITLDHSETKGKILIMVYLTSSPLVADVQIKSPGDSHLHAKFLLQSDTLGRFMEALRRRGVGKLSFLNTLTGVERKSRNISIGSGFKFTNNSSPIPPTASFEDKVQHVHQVYDVDDTTILHSVAPSPVGHSGSLPNPKPPFNDEILVPKVSGSTAIEDVPTTQKGARLILLSSGTSNSVRNIAVPFFPGDSTRANDLDGLDKLSEISQFEFDGDTTNEQATTGESASCNHRSELAQHKADRKRMNETFNVTCNRVKPSFEIASKTSGHTEGVAQRSPGTGKLLLISDPPTFGPSSSTQIDPSPKLLSKVDTLSTMVGTDGPSVASVDFIGTDTLNKKGISECGIFETEPIVGPAGKRQIGFDYVEDQVGQHVKCFAPSSGADQKMDTRDDTTKDTSVPPKIAGSRRKRESARSSRKLSVIEVDDECMPPPKKSREDRPNAKKDKFGFKEMLLDVISTSRVKRYSKMAKCSSPGTDPIVANFDDQAGIKPSYQGTRRSSRIRKKQITTTTTTSATRPNSMRGKTQKAKRADDQSARGMECKKLAVISLPDARAEMGHGTPSVLISRPIPPVVKDSPSTEINSQVPPVELSSAENITPETNLPRKVLKGNSSLTCTPSLPGAIPAKQPQGNQFAREAISDATKPIQEYFHVKTEEIVDDEHIASDVRTVDEIGRVREVAKYPVFLRECEDPVKTGMKSTLQRQTITVDLTLDDPPARDKNEWHTASADPVRSEASTIKASPRTPNLPISVAIEDATLVPSSRQRRRSVAFASPIEYMLDKKATPSLQVGSSALVECCSLAGRHGRRMGDPSTRSRRPPSPESNMPSPLGLPTGTMGAMHESSGPITPRVPLQGLKSLQVPGSIHDQTTEEVEIQDIVEVSQVLNEIQAVIVKGISDRFRNVKKDIQHSRNELIQQVLDELRGMVIENAKYFNGLLCLEEDYYKHCQALTRCWEKLIDCSESVVLQFQNVLKEHDQNISARVFPNSILPLQPAFARRRANAS